jgi:cytochrome P450
MIFGFILHPVLGLAMLAYIIWGDRLEGMSGDIREATDNFAAKFGRNGDTANYRSGDFQRTGNVAFDEWRDAELKRLDEERRKLDEARAEFDEYVRELRRARDSEEFDSFRKNRGKNGNDDGNGSVPSFS